MGVSCTSQGRGCVVVESIVSQAIVDALSCNRDDVLKKMSACAMYQMRLVFMFNNGDLKRVTVSQDKSGGRLPTSRPAVPFDRRRSVNFETVPPVVRTLVNRLIDLCRDDELVNALNAWAPYKFDVVFVTSGDAILNHLIEEKS